MVRTKDYVKDKDYLVYSDGRIYSKKSNKFLSQFLDNRGYYRVSICTNGKYTPALVHRMVCETFIDNPLNKETVNHIDENKANNDISNLEWATNYENVMYGTAHTRSGKTRRKKICAKDVKTNKEMRFESAFEAEEKGYGKYKTILQAIRVGSITSGCVWRYE